MRRSCCIHKALRPLQTFYRHLFSIPVHEGHSLQRGQHCKTQHQASKARHSTGTLRSISGRIENLGIWKELNRKYARQKHHQTTTIRVGGLHNICHFEEQNALVPRQLSRNRRRFWTRLVSGPTYKRMYRFARLGNCFPHTTRYQRLEVNP